MSPKRARWLLAFDIDIDTVETRAALLHRGLLTAQAAEDLDAIDRTREGRQDDCAAEWARVLDILEANGMIGAAE